MIASGHGHDIRRQIQKMQAEFIRMSCIDSVWSQNVGRCDDHI